VLDFREGRLVRFQDYADKRTALEVAGVPD
jgi:hypothetical protein